MKINDCRPRTARVAALLVLALFILSGAARADFKLVSLNCLHLGWGKQPYQAEKNQDLKNFFDGEKADVIVLQEVMRQADVGLVNPGEYEVAATPVQGASSYKEAYAFLVLKSKFNLTAPPDVVISKVKGISRPPAGILIKDGNTCTWVLDYHAIFGRLADRRSEVSKIGGVYKEFKGKKSNNVTCQVVIAGDWNLAANDTAFKDAFKNFPAVTIDVVPDKKTSLNPKGEFSESYDHCLAESGVIKHADLLELPTGMTNQDWRKKISDHRGIFCDIKTK
ncbi:MAG TPA: hypothetical protein VF756_29545 [Thermoanaerobaculia bacterium]